ncbi:aliphatic sulfonate ABC transporter permease SsuC, partial [Escherichia coli]
MILSPVRSRKAKEEIMATPVKKWLLRVAPWFLPVGIVAVWQLAS